MPTFSSGPPNFIVPQWMVSPIDGEETVRSGIKPRALFRIMILSREWTLAGTINWTVAGDAPETTGYANAGTATIADEVFGPLAEAPSTEREIETNTWNGFGFGVTEGSTNPISGHFIFTDTAVSPDETLASGFFGFQFQWVDCRPDRANTWETDELELMGQVTFSSPALDYSLVAGVSEPGDVEFDSRTYYEPIEWEDGKPGEPFFGTVTLHDAWSFGGYAYTYDVELTLTPSLYWEHGGKIDPDTGELVS